MKLIEIKKTKKVIFVGDTHGDLEVSQKVVKDYLKKENKIVFLGDYVERGKYSKENLDFLLEIQKKYPNQIYLLQGNHEGYRFLKFSPAEFWESLGENDYKKYCNIVEKFPLVLVVKDIIALHGVLPDVENLKKINDIELGDENWLKITWGDFVEKSGEYLGIDPLTGRPQFGRDYFFNLMERFGKKAQHQSEARCWTSPAPKQSFWCGVLIRSHQPDCPQFMFDDKCLTIFTSSAYKEERTIAIADFKKPIKTGKDLEIVKI